MAEPRVIAGKYRLERLLARGGMGSVWVAWHVLLEASVAIKLMAPSLVNTPSARQQFELEARAAARLRSPHVVQILDYGVEDDAPYIVMELLVGEDLRARLMRRQRLSLAAAARIATPVCKALALAHDNDIIHRDLKPGNIFLARYGDDEVVKLLDFGLAAGSETLSDAECVDAGAVRGSAHYMSPEQARGRRLDHRSDLWSLGAMLFRMITGENPFGGTALRDVLLRVCTEPVPVASTVVAVPPEVDAFFERALAHDPDERFQSAQEMAAALEFIAAPHQSPRERLSILPPPPLVPSILPPGSDEADLRTATVSFAPRRFISVHPPPVSSSFVGDTAAPVSFHTRRRARARRRGRHLVRTA